MSSAAGNMLLLARNARIEGRSYMKEMVEKHIYGLPKDGA